MSRRSALRGASNFAARALPAFILLILLYFNVAALLRSSGIRVHLPRPWYAARLFEIFSLFGYYVTDSYAFEARGRLAGNPDHRSSEWIEIDPYVYFPQTLGEANRRLNLYSFQGDDRKKGGAYRMMASRMAALHNSAEPNRRIDRIQIYEVRWPASPSGLRAEYEKRTYRLVFDG